ncbi:hypothetical protein OS493_037280 [Desmophyllum pertusum]|uniref:Uncharacterized protein n=1 Tax=Desmophyllum pertusum TaxID=174260 RepID=A0A9X0CDL4_9CNID|nr:hypothetical protein OS493_037280 [Desmophyllum pertusum]
MFLGIAVLDAEYNDCVSRIQLTRQEDKGGGREIRTSLQDLNTPFTTPKEVIKDFTGFILQARPRRGRIARNDSYLEALLEKASSKTMEEKEKAKLEMSEEDVVRFCFQWRLPHLCCLALGLSNSTVLEQL